MAKKKTATKLASTGEPEMDEADGAWVGQEPIPGMKLRCICRGHTGPIGRIAWSPCGRFIASPSLDRSIAVWDTSTGEQLLEIDGREKKVYAISWSPNGDYLASGNEDDTVRIWHSRTGKLRNTLNGHRGVVVSVAWARDDSMIASGASDSSVRLWDLDNGGWTELEGHHGWVNALAWDRNRQLIASGSGDYTLRIWNADNMQRVAVLTEANGHINSIDWSNGELLAAGCGDNVVRVWNTANGEYRLLASIEGHTDYVQSVAFSHDASLLASRSHDGTVRLVETLGWQTLGRITESVSEAWEPGISFHPSEMALATLGQSDSVVRIWDLNAPRLKLRTAAAPIHTTAKIVLVGESNVGKSCLAMRLAEDRYPEDGEHSTTHGMRFWPMEAENLHPSAKPPEGQRRDVVLWDFGGQDEYQLVHQMFLHDTTLALVLIDPTRSRAALVGAQDWNRRLEKHLGPRYAMKLLVGTKQDRTRSNLIHDTAIAELCEECGFANFIDLSAKTGRKIPTLRRAIARALDWDQLAKTSRPELFQSIRDDIEECRKRGNVVLLLEEVQEYQAAREHDRRIIFRFSVTRRHLPAVRTVIDQLAAQGVIVKTRLTGGDEALVLQLPVVERYAGSLIVAARNNPRGVPVLEERLLGSAKGLPLPGMPKRERLEREQEKIVLECIVELMIEHGLCFRHGGQLVFPTLFPSGCGDGKDLPHSVSLYYDFTGAIDNIYAALVSRLMVSGQFGEGRLKSGRVEFDRPGEGLCGIRQIRRTGGLAHVDLFFAESTSVERRDLFTRFVDEHLRQNGVEIREHQAIKCRCGEHVSERIIRTRIAAGEKDVVCPICETKTLIGDGVARIRERNPESDRKIIALRQQIQEETAKDVARAKAAVTSGGSTRTSADPIRLLHLSDLHFERDHSPTASLQWLLQDMRRDDRNFPKIEHVEYLVLSGDVTHKGDDAGFDVARQFVDKLIDEMGLSSLRCVFVPGNHDVQRRDSCYRLRSTVAGLHQRQFVKKGDVYLVRDEADYPNRLRQFSDAFYHKVTSSLDYPLAPEKQGMSYLFEDTGIQFLALNTAWEIDQFFPLRSGVYGEALANALEMAEKEVRDAIERRDLKKSQMPLRIAVFHHAVQGPWAMEKLDFLSNLQRAGVKLCLHGDVHEMRQQWIDHWDEDLNLHIVGAGTFGAKKDEITEGSARSYNLLEVNAALDHIRVYVREQPKPDGAWRGWNRFPDPDGGRGKVPFFDIELD